jgi:glycosyltransferase involved in cell wall biosynthesis
MTEITVALPAYNEAANINKVLTDTVSHLESLGKTWEVLVIDNNSTDSTSRVAKEFSAKEPRVRVTRHEENRLYSGSCETAIKEARGELIAIMDSDGQVSARDLPRFLGSIDQGANLVFGWRRDRHDPRSRLIMSEIFNRLGKHYLGFPLHDLNCGFRVFDRTFGDVANIQHRINLVNPELYVRATNAGLSVDEVEVTHWAREGGETSHDLRRSWHLFREVTRYLADLGNELDVASKTQGSR